MSDQIVPGDLVVVVHIGHHCAEYLRGFVFKVAVIWPACRRTCRFCYQIYSPNELAVCWEKRYDTEGVPMSWLKKIPPLSELEGKLDLADIRGPQPIKERA